MAFSCVKGMFLAPNVASTAQADAMIGWGEMYIIV